VVSGSNLVCEQILRLVHAWRMRSLCLTALSVE